MKNILRFSAYGFLALILTAVTAYAIINKQEFVIVISGVLLLLALIQMFLMRKG